MISFRDWGGNEEPNLTYGFDMFNGFYNLRETTCFSVIEKVRQTGMVIFPFVQPGHKYFITACFYNNNDDIESIKTTECITDRWIYPNSNITLDLNNASTGVTLSSAPSFTSDVQLVGIGYHIFVLTGDYMEVFSGGYDELFWDFEPKFKEYLKEISLVNGDYPTFVEANASIIHDNILWVINIANTPVFTYSF